MRKPELDFLRETPAQPTAAWLLLAAGLLLSGMAAGRYLDAERSLAGERAIAASLEVKRPAAKPARGAAPAQAQVQAQALALAAGREQLDLPWDTLFLRLEQSRPDEIALLSLEADGRKREATLTAEARKPGQMLDYVERLRHQPGLDAVVLSSHAVRQEDPQQPLRFVVRLRWRT